jgi:hypothetical protein
MDNIWKNAAETAIHSTTATTATTVPTAATGNPSTTLPAPSPSYNTKTITLEELTEMRHRLVQDWPLGDGITFPQDILDVLDVLRVKIVARDAARQRHAEVATYTVQVIPATETASKKAEKKCRLRAKRAAANKQMSVDVDGVPVSLAHCTSSESSARGPVEGFGVFPVLFRPFVRR